MFSRIVDGIVAERLDLPAGAIINEMFHEDVAATIFPAPDDVQQGWTYADGHYAAPSEPEIDLAALKSALRASVDAGAEAERRKYITAGAGQAMTYQQKAAEAKAFMAAEAPDAADYPMLSAEVGITAADIAGVAASVLEAEAAWRQIGSAIEGVRLGAKKAIDEAINADGAQAAADVVWPA